MLTSVLAFAGILTVSAQSRTVGGTVTDAKGQPLVGVTVLTQAEGGGNPVGTTTDASGRYTLKVPDGAKELNFSYIGYNDVKEPIGTRTRIDASLEESSVMMEEVVAIGYAKVKRKDVTGSTVSVSGKDLAQIPVMTAAQALQGKAAGVNIVTANGAPGAGVNVTIRGGTSITQSTKPLYIVDGFEMDDALTAIDINDIETIDVLKDASATAIYGARGSNGIILITTKSAQKGKTQVSYNTYFAFDVLSKKLDVLSDVEEYANYQYELTNLSGNLHRFSSVYDDDYGSDQEDFYTGAYQRMANRYGGLRGVDWQDRLFGGSAMTQSHNVNIMTGTDKTQVMLSYNYNGQDGLLSNHGVYKNTFRAKVNSELYKGIRIDLNTSFSNKKTEGGGAYSGMKSVLMQPIDGGTMFTRDQLLNTQTYPDYSSLDGNFDTANPIVANEASTSLKRARSFNVNAGLEFDFLKHFTWRTAGSYSWSQTKGTSFADENSTAYIMNSETEGINGGINNKESYRYQITNTLNYNQTFNDKHKLGILAGHEVSYSESEEVDLKLNLFPFPNFGLDDIKGSNVKEKTSKHGHGGLVSFFARANYSYDERYLLTATVRADGSAKFAPGNRWGVFPSVSAAWRISEEDFFKDSKVSNVIDGMKLRVGYGTTGNCNIDSYMYLTKISQTDYPMNNNEGFPAYVPGTELGNKDLKWETVIAANVGLELAMFRNRLNITAEWYNNQSNDLLMKCTIPTSTGYKSQYQNIGKMRNRGWEVSINTVNVQAKNFRWTSDLNLSFNRSKVVSLEKGQTEKTFVEGGNRSGTVTYYANVGRSLGDMYGYKYEGVYTTDDFIELTDGRLILRDGVVKPYGDAMPQPGDMKFAADNEDGTQFTRKMVKIGNGTPDCVGGFNNTFMFFGVDLTVFMKFSIGNDVYNATKHSLSPYASFQNIPTEFNDYYRLIDPATGMKAASLARLRELNPNEKGRTWSLSNNNTAMITYPSSYFVEDGSYLRIGQITLGYTFPKKWMQKIRISNARIYFTVNNVATITGYSGYDPEVSSANDHPIITPGYDSSAYPRARSYVAGLNLTF